MDIFELAEINFGLILNNKASVMAYDAADFPSPFDDGIRTLQKPGAKREDLTKVISASILQDAYEAVSNLNTLGEFEGFDWSKALREAAVNARRAKIFKRLAEKMEKNESVDLIPAYGELTSAVNNQAGGLTLATDIDYSNYKPFIKCGWKAIDDILGGIPADGPVVVFGGTGVGKSHWSTKMTVSLLKQYPEWKAAVYTLEMSAEHWMWRASRMYPEIAEVADRLYVSGMVKQAGELVAEAMIKDVQFVVVDDIDHLASEQSASAYEATYQTVEELSRFKKIPIFLLGQPNRTAKLQLSERFLGPYDVAWSGAAENRAAMLIALQKTNELDMEGDLFPTFPEDHFYMIFHKSRDGWPGDYDVKGQFGPGAIILSPSKQMWGGEAKGGRLWQPGAAHSLKKRAKRNE